MEDVKAILEVETGILLQAQVLFKDGQVLSGNTVADCGLREDDLLLVQKQQQRLNPRDPNAVREAIRTDPSIAAQVRSNNPELAEAALNDDPAVFRQLWTRIQLQKEQDEERRMLERGRLAADPLDPTAQAAIEQEIQQSVINETYETAMEHNPEVFGSVVMLYVDCEVNSHPLKAFVDSGAQMTIMSQACARRCNLLHLVDKRFQGVAKGVGTSKIIGRIHSAPFKIKGLFLPISITVLEDDGMEFLFGLDNLKRHQCCIDLQNNVLRFGEGVVADFLPEHELPLANRDLSSDVGESPKPAKAPRTDALPEPTPQVVSGTTAAAPRPADVAPPLPTGVSHAAVERLQALGFGREQVLRALQQAQNNEDVAAGFLFG